MKKFFLAFSIVCLSAIGLSSPVLAGFTITDTFDCATSGDTNLTDYFCDGTDLHEVNVHCWNLDADIGGSLEVGANDGEFRFVVKQDTDDTDTYVCDLEGYYVDSDKTEVKCTDAPKGPNKSTPGNNPHGGGYDQAGFEIKNLGYDEICD